MLRPIRLVLMIVSISVALGFAGLRMSGPPPANAFSGGSGGPGWHFDIALKVYGKLYEIANNAPMPDIMPLLGGGSGHRAPEIGRTGFGDTDMGRSLSEMRARQTGSRPAGGGYSDLVGHVQQNLRSMEIGVQRSSGPPPANARRITVD